jgi:hypothetical protein|nr:MAG TPA: acetyltransferase domain containing protein [Caudoviricetes sp.]
MQFRKMTCEQMLANPLYEGLWHEYRDEAAYTAERLEPDFQHYQALEDTGNFDITGVFDDDGNLIGFFTLILSKLPHFKAQLLASTETLFLSKRARKGSAGVKLIMRVQERAKELGASSLLIGTQAGTRGDKLCEALGFVRQNVVWATRL